MQVRDVRIPATLFCQVADLVPATLRKWTNGNWEGETDASTLRLECDRAAQNGPNSYTFADLVRVLLLQRLRDDLAFPQRRQFKSAMRHLPP